MASSNSFNPTVLFKQENGFGYRIPALLHIPDTGTLLAFAEKRLGSRDEDADALMLRRGTYKKSLKNFEWEDVTPIESARLEGHRSMNPCAVYDKDTGTVFLFFIVVRGNVSEQYQIKNRKNVTGLCFVTSKDKGQNWSSRTDLTDPNIKKWATFAVGPGHGIQLKSGRLTIPAYAYEIQSDGQVMSRVFTFFSDDHGESWNCGGFVSREECGECQMVSVDQGNGLDILYCNARSIKRGDKQYRVQAVSTDGGDTFTDGSLVKMLAEPPNGCHGSIIHFPASKLAGLDIYPVIKNYHHLEQKKKENDTSELTENFEIILFSHTTNFKSRRDLGMYLSTYPGSFHTWTKPWIIHPGPSAYSELAFVEFPGEDIPLVTCLFECGCNSECEQISFSVFQVDEIIKNILKEATY